MLVLTADGRATKGHNSLDGATKIQAVDEALDRVREFTTPNGDRPFSHLKRIHYSMNRDGILYTLTHHEEELEE